MHQSGTVPYRALPFTPALAALAVSTFDAQEAPVGSVSIACLSCHDGTQAMDAVINSPGSDSTGFVEGGTAGATDWMDGTNTATAYLSSLTASDNGTMGDMIYLGTDLRNDHPISMQYGGGPKTGIGTDTHGSLVAGRGSPGVIGEFLPSRDGRQVADGFPGGDESGCLPGGHGDVGQQVADAGNARDGLRESVAGGYSEVFAPRDDHQAPAHLRGAILRCQQLRARGVVAEIVQAFQDGAEVSAVGEVDEAGHVLDDDASGVGLTSDPQDFAEEVVPLVPDDA